MMRRVLLLTLLLPLFCAGFGVGARAATAAVPPPPTLTTACLASMETTSRSFGSINILSGAAIDAEGWSTFIKCPRIPPGSVVRVCVGYSDTAPRKLNKVDNYGNSIASKTLDYEIYPDGGHSHTFGSINESIDYIDLPGKTTAATFNFYGRIFGNQQSASVGDYNDTPLLYTKVILFSSPPSALAPCASDGVDRLLLPVGLMVFATITPNCSISNIQDMIFPSQTIFTGDVTEQTPAQFTVKCTTDAPYAIGLDDGLNATNGRCSSLSQRCMVSKQNAANRLDYDLYHTTQRLSRWGATDPLAVGAGGKPRIGKYAGETITVYGKIPKPTPSPAPGDYSDTITVTVTY